MLYTYTQTCLTIEYLQDLERRLATAKLEAEQQKAKAEKELERVKIETAREREKENPYIRQLHAAELMLNKEVKARAKADMEVKLLQQRLQVRLY